MASSALVARRLSLPPTESTSTDSSSSLTELSIMSTPSPSNPASTSVVAPSQCQQSQSVSLMSRAESLAKMTFELNIRAINHQTDKLQRDVQTLVQSTVEDREFREKHEDRLKKLWQEMLAVKQHMSRIQEEQRHTTGSETDYEKCQRETLAVIDEFRNDIGDVKALIDGLSKQIDELPATIETTESGYSSQQKDFPLLEGFKPTQHMTRQQSMSTDDNLERSFTAVSEELTSQGHSSTAVAAASRRIIETIESTKRWHREHKTTNLTDGQFSANYLNKQSKRDAKLAAYIQRKIKLRIRKRQRSDSTPKTLEEFCKDVTWEDVIATVQEFLVKGKKTAIRAIM